jgi:hypothetical protein
VPCRAASLDPAQKDFNTENTEGTEKNFGGVKTPKNLLTEVFYLSSVSCEFSVLNLFEDDQREGRVTGVCDGEGDAMDAEAVGDLA